MAINTNRCGSDDAARIALAGTPALDRFLEHPGDAAQSCSATRPHIRTPTSTRRGRGQGRREPGGRVTALAPWVTGTRGGYARCVMWSERVDTVLVDVDGTLVDSNYQHALAWFRAFRQHDITLPVWTIHRPSAWAATSSSPTSPTTTVERSTATR